MVVQLLDESNYVCVRESAVLSWGVGPKESAIDAVGELTEPISSNGYGDREFYVLVSASLGEVSNVASKVSVVVEEKHGSGNSLQPEHRRVDVDEFIGSKEERPSTNCDQVFSGA